MGTDLQDMTDSRKLNMFQRGILQQIAVGVVYAACCLSAMFCLDKLIKYRFIRLASQAQNQDIIDSETADLLKKIIQAPDMAESFFIILLIVFFSLLGWFLMRWAARLNLSWPVSLPRAVEFSTAMCKMGIFAFIDQMAFIHKNRLPVYNALKPIIGESDENIRARLYPYAHNDILFVEVAMATNIGQRLLCLDSADYDPVYQQYIHAAQLANSTKIVELEQDIEALKGYLRLKDDDNIKLVGENSKLCKEITDLRNKLRTAPGRGKNIENGEQRKAPFWRVAGPLINRLVAEARSDTKYTRSQIQAEFLDELENYPELKMTIKKLLYTPKKKAAGSPFDLTGWGMELIREGLGELVQRDGGAPQKS